ncbi:MAG: cation:proton antiporter [Prochlorothrix sp.]
MHPFSLWLATAIAESADPTADLEAAFKAALKPTLGLGLFHWHGLPPVAITLIWVALPFFVGFSAYLLPRFDRIFALSVTLVSLVYGVALSLSDQVQILHLIDRFGVTLQLDALCGYFILTNALVTLAVIFYCWHQGKSAFFYTQVTILQGSVNAAFICADFISLYVALEVISIAAFLLITYSRSDRSIWVGLCYLFVGNTSMLFYLLGAILVYQSSHSFAFVGLAQAPKEAIAFIFLGLLSKGGVFASGLWLPFTHGESETPVSALLSGVVVKTGILPLLRLALLQPEIDPVVRLFGVATALLGVTYAIFSKDSKRMLAFHTISQLGFVLAAPAVGGFYALTHGLVKASLFLTAGNLPSRSFKVLKKTPLPPFLWGALALASFSIAGLPLFAGFGAKALTVNYLLPWQETAMNIAAVGTAISFAKFIFLPIAPLWPWSSTGHNLASNAGSDPGHNLDSHAGANASPEPGIMEGESVGITPGYAMATAGGGAIAAAVPVSEAVRRNLLPALGVLIGSLLLGNMIYLGAYTGPKLIKAIVTLAIGWTLYHTVLPRLNVKLSQTPERFEHLIGAMSLMLTLIFWMVVA